MFQNVSVPSSSKNNIKNRIVVKANPRQKLSRTTIFSDTTSQLMAGDTSEFWCQFSHGTDNSIPAVNVEVPTIGVDILANTNSDGSGTDISSDIEMTSYYIFGESIKINLKNNNANTAYFTTFRVYGEPIVIESRIEVIKEDLNSQKLYDVQELQIENDYIDSETFAESLY